MSVFGNTNDLLTADFFAPWMLVLSFGAHCCSGGRIGNALLAQIKTLRLSPVMFSQLQEEQISPEESLIGVTDFLCK